MVIGAIGDRGAGKSALSAVLAILAFMMRGKPVWSNMKIKLDLEISDSLARENGLTYGGVAHYESLPLEKEALLKLDDTYRGGCLVIEEINVQFSNVRRFMTNTNINFNEVCQQLRKFRASMLYNVIDEMFIDSQLRALTDVFIISYDTAFDMDSLAKHKPTGLDFNWLIYPMSGYLQGEQGKYAFTKKPLKRYFHFGRWRGVYDSFKHQEKGKYSQTTKEQNANLETSAEINAFNKEWGWLGEKIISLKDRGIEYLKGPELSMEIGCPLEEKVKRALQSFGVGYDRFHQAYSIDNFDLERERAAAQTL